MGQLRHSHLRRVLIVSLLLAGLWRPTVFREGAAVGRAYAHGVAGLGQAAATAQAEKALWLSQPGLAATDPISPTDSGGGEYRLLDVSDLSDQQRQSIQSEIDRNIQRLGLQPLAVGLSTSLSWPLQGAAGQTDYGYHGISGFVDHNFAYPNQLLDWNCGTRTYDLASGYNHKGTDFFTWPFGWYNMDHDIVEVVAAAPGTIVAKSDGAFDRSCSLNNNPWNAVYILHADGAVAWYGHLKQNSVTSKAVGAAVVAGEYLGIVGSSGNSTGPHLHFELHASDGNLIDPYAGACNPTSSWWAAQRPYFDSAVNKLTTGSAAAVFPTCPSPETPNTKDVFSPGDTVYFTTYYRDQLAGQQSRYTIYRPDGSVYSTWTHATSVTHYAASYWYWSYALSAGVPVGLWRFEVVYQGQVYQHNFSVGSTVDLRGRPADHALRLDWTVWGTLPVNSTWRIAYAGPAGDQPSPITNIMGSIRTYTLTGLTNYNWYTVTLNAIDNTFPIMTGTVTVLPTDIYVYLPQVTK